MKKLKSPHPSVSIVDGEPRLNIVANFYIDKRLPKYSSKLKDSKKYSYMPDGGTVYRRHFNFKFGFLNWLKGKFKVNPLDSMNDAKEKVKELDSVDQLEVAFKKANEIADKIDKSGQYELALSIRNSAMQIAQEIVLKKNGIHKCLEEKDILEVLQKADFGMRIDFLEHYPQILPDEIANKKIKIDELNIFDNYAVLHFDPNGSSLKIQKAEEIRRDPILFGMIQNSTRLYFIADWVIGNDDITLEKVEKILGRSALPAQFISSQHGDIFNNLFDEEPGETESTAIQ